MLRHFREHLRSARANTIPAAKPEFGVQPCTRQPINIRFDSHCSLVAIERVVQFAEILQRPAAVIMRFAETRLEAERPLVALQRLIVSSQAAQDVAAIVMGAGEIRLGLQRAIVALQRGTWAPEMLEGNAAVVVRI